MKRLLILTVVVAVAVGMSGCERLQSWCNHRPVYATCPAPAPVCDPCDTAPAYGGDYMAPPSVDVMPGMPGPEAN